MFGWTLSQFEQGFKLYNGFLVFFTACCPFSSQQSLYRDHLHGQTVKGQGLGSGLHGVIFAEASHFSKQI